jgi:hypothetical protein
MIFVEIIGVLILLVIAWGSWAIYTAKNDGSK